MCTFCFLWLTFACICSLFVYTACLLWLTCLSCRCIDIHICITLVACLFWLVPTRRTHPNPNLLSDVKLSQSCIHYDSFGVIICDESHALKSHSAKRTQFMWPVVQHASRAILITGTPALSRPIELFPQVSPFPFSLPLPSLPFPSPSLSVPFFS